MDGQLDAWTLLTLSRLGPAPVPLWPSSPIVASPARRHDRKGPVNAGEPWSPERDAALRDEWLASTGPVEALLAELADRYGRSTSALVSRLLKLLCHPENPGQTVTEAEALTIGRQIRSHDNRPPATTTADPDTPPF